ncbi:MAG: hypothetical protein E2598_09240 [Sphingobium sp.]|nr:hypothetical protein [Sphingobium sp.]
MVTSRRTLLAGAVAVPLLAIGGAALMQQAQASTGGTLLLYDEDLNAGRRFAAQAQILRGQPMALNGDRIRFMRDMLRQEPSAIYGVSRYSDQLMVSDIAREAGYRPLALIQHRADGGVVPQCQPAAQAIATVASVAGGRWPEAFAELALGGTEQCSTGDNRGAIEAAMSWVLVRRG